MILSLWTAFRALPRGWHYLAAGVLLCLALFAWHRLAVRDAVRDDRAEQAAKVQERAGRADKAAVGTVAGAQASMAARTEAAKDAAAGSDDPLKAGLRELGK